MTGVDLMVTTGGEVSNNIHIIRFSEFPEPFGMELTITKLPMSWAFVTEFDTFPHQLKNLVATDFQQKSKQIKQIIESLNESNELITLTIDGRLFTDFEAIDPRAEIDFSGNFKFDPFPENELSQNSLEVLKKLISTWVLIWLIFLENDTLVPPNTELIGEVEGAIKRGEFTWRERSRKNRAACLAEQGYTCGVCRQNMADVYGDVAETLIHVHHIIPVGSLQNPIAFDPRKDLIPLCPNCHYAAHLKSPPYTPEELRVFIDNQKAGEPESAADY